MRTFKSVTIAILLVAAFMTLPNTSQAENPIRITTQEDVISIHQDSSALLRYGYRNVPYKPCVQQLFTPGGINVLRDSPADHQHHHALMYAVSVDGLNFWEEQKEPGRQRHKSFCDVTVNAHSGVPRGSFCERLDWVNPKTDELLLNESRTIAVSRLDESAATLLSWQS
nr:PmoA family protein [Planctomycetota bacterium]